MNENNGPLPCPFCGGPAYGEADDRTKRETYVPALACPGHGGPECPPKELLK
jgi:hypothetical protein